MIVMLLAGAASLVLFVTATALILEASVKPPVPIRTESRRSPEEYAFKRRSVALRRKGFLCLTAGGVNLCLCVTIAIVSVVGNLD